MRIVIALAAAALIASPLSAQDNEPQADAEETSAKSEDAPAAEEKDDGKICRSVSQVGSRKKERKCMTQKQWLKFNRGE